MLLLDPNFFKYTSNDDEYTLLYNCDSLGYTSSVNIGGAIAFNCPIDGGLPAFFVLSTEVVNLNNLGCKNSINVSVLGEAVKVDSVVGIQMWGARITSMFLECGIKQEIHPLWFRQVEFHTLRQTLE